jgi:UDP-N-acetylmuramate: L-alanyl-gamma-D-glutamyl-meso-diaminopimelate ligase
VIERGGKHFADCRMTQSGRHSVLNALSVTAAASAQGLSSTEIAAGLASFRGVRRRLEFRGEADGVRVLDDFAHHPTAIAITLEAVRNRYPASKIWAVLEPRSWSLRRNVFQQRLIEVFDSVDQVILAPVFRADDVAQHDRLDVQRLAGDLAGRSVAAHAAGSIDEILEKLETGAGPGDVVVVMSNGGFDGLHTRLLDALRLRAASTSTAGG